MPGSSMQKLPAELLASIMLHVDPYCVPFKFALTRVSSYWRAVALNSQLLWATFEIDSTAAARVLPILIQRSGAGSSHDSTPLDVRLTFGYLFSAGDRNRQLLPASRDAAVALLARPDIAAHIAALDITYSNPGALRLLIGADLYLPQLERLHVCRSPNAQSENIHIAITAPRLRHLRLIRTAPRSWNALLVQSLEHVRIEHCGPEAHIGVLATILRQCPSLAHLAFFTHDRAPLEITRDLWPMIRGEERPVPPSPGRGQAGADSAYDSDNGVQLPLRHLSSFCLEVPTDLHNANQILASLADALVIPRTISTCVKTGFFISSTGALMHSLLRGLGPLDTLSLHTVSNLTIGDELGRERSVRVWDEYGAWEMPDMWRFLAKEYNAHRRVRRFVLDTHAWVALADALAVVPPGSNPPGATNPDSRPPDPRGVELVVRPHYKLIARGEPDLMGSDGSSPSESGLVPHFDDEDELDEDALRLGLEEEDPLAAARASDALVDPYDEQLAQGWTTRSLVIPNLRLIKIDIPWAVSYAQQRRGVLRVLRWVEPRRNASRSNYSYMPYYAPAAQHTLPSGNGYGYGCEEQTQVCAAFAEISYTRDTRPRELRRLAAQLAADGRGFTLCGHCWAIASPK